MMMKELFLRLNRPWGAARCPALPSTLEFLEPRLLLSAVTDEQALALLDEYPAKNTVEIASHTPGGMEVMSLDWQGRRVQAKAA